MNPLLKKYLSPVRAVQALRKRGARNAWHHALRRLGTICGRALVGPETLALTPMDTACNHACVMCWHRTVEPEELKKNLKIDREDGLRLDDYRRLFDSMPAGLQRVILVGGGEPLVHPDAVELIREIKRRGWDGILVTNGTLLDPAVARAMVESRWNLTRVSVHAGDRATYQAIHGVDRFETLRRNLREFMRLREEAGRRADCQLVMYYVIQRENLPTIERLFDFSAEFGCDEIFFEKLVLYNEDLALTREEMAEACRRLEAAAPRCPVPCNLDNILANLRVEQECLGAAAGDSLPFRPAARCSVGFDEATVHANGVVTPCCFSPENMGQVKDRPFREIWYGPRYANFRRRLIRGQFPGYCITHHCAMNNVLHD
ncbi:MAG: radical SAM protein [bacterium]|nr:radical SAM protein [bacterium]